MISGLLLFTVTDCEILCFKMNTSARDMFIHFLGLRLLIDLLSIVKSLLALLFGIGEGFAPSHVAFVLIWRLEMQKSPQLVHHLIGSLC
jgi:hypothetical protein